ncbi:MAG: 50S ribosomal protein L4 [Candidatus Saccharimonadia bacterium]
MAIAYYSKTGTKKETTPKLDAAIFAVEPNHDLIDMAYRTYLANGRAVSATTLTRGDVRGGGKKPWKQKGTGRARVGSSRVPNWRGGGVVFGPSGNENYSISMSSKMKHLAIRQALSLQASDSKITIIEDFLGTGKVKDAVQYFAKLKIEGQILLVVAKKDAQLLRSTNNIAGLTTVSAAYLNVFDILNNDHILITEPCLVIIKNWLDKTSISKAAAPMSEDKS